MVTLRSARLGRSPVSTASPGSIEEERHDSSETSRDSAAANPCGRGSPARRDGDPRGGVYPMAEAAQGRAQYAANRDGSRLHWPITRPATMLVLGLPR